MNDAELIPRPYVRAAIVAAIILVLIAGSVTVANYVLTVVQQRQHQVAVAAQEAAVTAEREAAEQQARADEQWLGQTGIVSVRNDSSNTVYLWTGTPNGTNADGSAVYSHNAICSASPSQSCSATVYVHRGVQIKGSNSPWSANNPNWQWQLVPEQGLALRAWDTAPSPTATPCDPSVSNC